jgi:site-specific DNA-methyltransferase (adenine-specific)
VYTAKPSRAERDLGLAHFSKRSTRGEDGEVEKGVRNVHPTGKSVALMRYLCRLITPPRGVVLDFTVGSGTTGVAALIEGFRFLGCELMDTDDEPFVSIALARLQHALGYEFVPRDSLRTAEPPRQRSLFG